ncbi:MAG: hypothetical protein U0S36_08480 [Candidatus Nanopelagicales bacterium]
MLAAPLGALLLAGCSMSCTMVGCGSEVVVDIDALTAAYRGDPLQSTLCLDDVCRTAAIDPRSVNLFATVPDDHEEGQPIRVRLSITSGSRTLVDSSLDVVPAKIAPNGEKCGPICWQSGLSVEDGRLVESRAPSTA